MTTDKTTTPSPPTTARQPPLKRLTTEHGPVGHTACSVGTGNDRVHKAWPGAGQEPSPASRLRRSQQSRAAERMPSTGCSGAQMVNAPDTPSTATNNLLQIGQPTANAASRPPPAAVPTRSTRSFGARMKVAAKRRRPPQRSSPPRTSTEGARPRWSWRLSSGGRAVRRAQRRRTKLDSRLSVPVRARTVPARRDHRGREQARCPEVC